MLGAVGPLINVTSPPRRVFPPMRFRQDGRSMSAFWVQLPVQVRDRLGCEHVQIQRNEPEVYESHRLELRGNTFLFDEIEDLFAEYLDDSARLTWSLDVEVIRRAKGRICPLRVEGWKHVPREAVVGTYPRPSFFIRAAITMDTRVRTAR